jgi:citronellyl-CoA dehydrogenase
MIFTQEHEELRRSVRRFIDSEINPYVDEWEEAEIFPAHELFKKLGDAGFLGITKPEAFGGMGLDYSYGMAFTEELGHVNCSGVPMAIGVQTDMATPALARNGSDELRAEFLAPAISGDAVACIGVSEPGAGSDVAGIKTQAVKDGDDYVINGEKTWITNGTQADWICLLANTGEGQVHQNKSLICVPMNTKGVSIARKIRKIGNDSSDTAHIFFDDVRVPQRNRIGMEGHGFVYQMQQFQEERLWAAAKAITSLENVVHFRMAELQSEVESLRALTYRAVELYINGDDVTRLASMAKLKAGRLAREVTDACLQYWGGMGYTWENPVSRAYRDARLGSIGGGADEIMLGIICKYMGILPTRRNR